jgi:hypothetical protein
MSDTSSESAARQSGRPLHIGKPLAAGIRGGSSKASAVSAAGRCADQERADAGLFVGQGSYPGGGTIAVEARDTGDQPRRLGRHIAGQTINNIYVDGAGHPDAVARPGTQEAAEARRSQAPSKPGRYGKHAVGLG